MKLTITLIIILLLSSCNNSTTIDVKYNDNKVEITKDSFEIINNLSSSFINNVWYNQDNEYLILDLNWVNYEYCDFDISEWESFKKADSFWKYYNSYIKGNFNCY